MSKTLSLLILLFAASSCSLIAPINSHYESANTIKKGQLEIGASIDKYDYFDKDNYDEANYNFGGSFGYGLGETVDLKFKYHRLNEFESMTEGDLIRVNFYSVSPKFMIIKDRMAIKLPFNFYQFHEEGQNELVTSIAPAVLFSWPISQNSDFTSGIQYQHSFQEDYADQLGISFGFRLSKDVDIWSVRPELGLQTEPSSFSFFYFNYGVAFFYNFNLK